MSGVGLYLSCCLNQSLLLMAVHQAAWLLARDSAVVVTHLCTGVPGWQVFTAVPTAACIPGIQTLVLTPV